MMRSMLAPSVGRVTRAPNGRFRVMVLLLPIALIAIASQLRMSNSLRTGAPALACLNLRPLHGLHRAKPASASQFFVSQSSFGYSPGQNITVEITTHSSERYFRGFIVQAYDPTSGAQIGHFLSTNDSRPIDSCSAATHRNNLNKKLVTLTWLPPGESQSSATNQWLGLPHIQPMLSMSVNNRKRQLAGTPAPTTTDTGLHQVRFRATIVVAYEEFYTGFESSDQKFDKFDYANSSARNANPPAVNPV